MSHTHTLKYCGTKVVVVEGKDRRIAGGDLVTVERTDDSPFPAAKARDGSTLPMYRKGYRWEEPRENLRPV